MPSSFSLSGITTKIVYSLQVQNDFLVDLRQKPVHNLNLRVSSFVHSKSLYSSSSDSFQRKRDVVLYYLLTGSLNFLKILSRWWNKIKWSQAPLWQLLLRWHFLNSFYNSPSFNSLICKMSIINSAIHRLLLLNELSSVECSLQYWVLLDLVLVLLFQQLNFSFKQRKMWFQ